MCGTTSLPVPPTSSSSIMVRFCKLTPTPHGAPAAGRRVPSWSPTTAPTTQMPRVPPTSPTSSPPQPVFHLLELIPATAPLTAHLSTLALSRACLCWKTQTTTTTALLSGTPPANLIIRQLGPLSPALLPSSAPPAAVYATSTFSRTDSKFAQAPAVRMHLPEPTSTPRLPTYRSNTPPQSPTSALSPSPPPRASFRATAII